MPVKDDPWHFARPALATYFIEQFDIGLSNRLTLVAPRRKGKTEFLLYDLAPAAEKAGYQAVYASLWADIDAPQKGLLAALRMATDAKRKRRSITRTVLTAAVNRVKVDALGIGAEIAFAEKPKTTSSAELEEIDQLIDALNTGKRTKLLLILDEVQHLGTEKAFMPLMFALRSSLDQRRDVRVVYSGSSRGGIRRMFGDHDAPFYGSSTEIELPDLDRAFTDFLAATFKQLARRSLNATALWAHFKRVDRNPFYAREALKLMALEPSLTLPAAMDRLLTAIAEQNGYLGKWAALNALDRALFLAIAENPDTAGLHGKDSLATLSEATGKPVTAPLVGRRLQRLVEQNLVSRTKRSTYQIELPGFKEWAMRTQSST